MYALYARVSTLGQRDDKTIDQQLEMGQKWFSKIEDKNKGKDIAVYKDDGISGSYEDIDKRQALVRLLKDIEDKKITVLWIYDTKRLSRNDYTFSDIKKVLHHNNVIVYTSDKKYNLNNNSDNFMFNIMGNIGALDKDTLVAQLRRGRNKIQNEGIKTCRAFYGYKQNGRENVKPFRVKWEPDMIELNRMKYAFSYYLQTKSLMKLAKEMDNTTTREQSLQKTSLWSTRFSHIEYTGKMIDTEGNIIPCINFPIEVITLKNWKLVQELLKSNSSSVRLNMRSSMATGILTCAKCGKKYYYGRSKGNYYYYKHLAVVEGNHRYNHCDQKPNSIRSGVLDDIFTIVYLTSLFDKEDLSFFLSKIEEEQAKKKNITVIELSHYDSKIKGIDDKINNIRKSIVEGIDASLFTDDLKKLLTEKKEVEREKVRLSLSNTSSSELYRFVQKLQYEGFYDWYYAEEWEKRQLLIKFISSATINDSIVNIKTIHGREFNFDTKKVEAIELERQSVEEKSGLNVSQIKRKN